ncbi:NmrA family NAD(P)-binding protein [Nocardioides alcanivorans]|uniref:NmrA family NAD(P)-binding protein n=1 Tax=Nocardioides alcanivorans TaxID=2897352 RepID=UPI001F15B618|nr:NmrA family NAD(P)-binding protein [Nocardioides alcanivorans]
MSTSADLSVAVLGGHGKTGQSVCRALAARGVSARALGRGDLAAPGGLTAALRGCVALYLLAPNMHPDELSYAEEALAAARAAGVSRVVHHSVASPFAPSMPHHLAKAHAEDAVRRSGLAWTVLQPGAYVQNFLPALRADVPELAVPYDVHALFGFADLVDVGEVAAEVIISPEGHLGATYEIAGPGLASVSDVASAAARVLGREVACRRTDPGGWADGPGAGLPERERAWLLRMFDHYDRHGLPVGGRGVRAVLGRDGLPLVEVVRRELG